MTTEQLLKEYFTIKDEIKALKNQRAKFSAAHQCTGLGEGYCYDRLEAIPLEVSEYCDNCLTKNTMSGIIHATASQNAGRLRKLRTIAKNTAA